jgi:phosphoribosylglycinamide formyltransferase-1
MTSSNYKIGVLVSGRGTNLQAIIDTIENGELKARIAVVISDKKDAPALERSRKQLKNRQVDLVCLAGYMRILSPEFIGIFSGKIINIHPSLLPAFPGLNVQQKAIDYGVKFSGCTVHFVNEEVDGGAIILQAVVPVHDSDDAQTLADRILIQEHLIYPKAIQMIIENRLHIENRKVTLKESIAS